MWNFSRFHKAASRHRRILSQLALSVAVVTVGACSSDVTRFDEPGFGLTDAGAANRTPRPSRGLVGNSAPPTDRYSYAQPAVDRQQVDAAALPAPDSYPAQDRYMSRYAPPAGEREPVRRPPVSYDRPARQQPPTLAPATRAAPVASARELTVARGDTLYGLSRRHGVSVPALMRENGLSNTTLRPGQVLRLPTGASDTAVASRQSTPQPTTRRNAAAQSRIVTAAPPSAWTGEYTVENGDSLYLIARRYDVKVSDLQRFNGITDPRRVRTGTVLKVPGIRDGRGAGDPVVLASRDTSTTGRMTDSAPVAPPASSNQGTAPKPPRAGVSVLNGQGSTQPTTRPRVVQSVRVTPPAKTRPSIVAPSTTKLRWPVNGKVVSKFGRRADGTHNDGINLEVPAGTSVKAADNGVVAYAGSELRGYGNLVLVRHDNGWVTAYAHNENVLVKRGDKVARGQVIAKAGKTGEVDRPQVHFELRRDAKPVDPLPYLEAL